METMYGKSLITVDSLSLSDVTSLFQKADTMQKIVAEKGATDSLKGKVMAALFYEPSSRTFSSFITAMQRLGGGFIPLNGMMHTSVAKGETIEDTAKVFSSYADIIVMRHPEVGSVARLTESATVPVINAGDGKGEHPTQALLDGYTIQKHFSSLSSLTVGMIGDLLYGRTVHSLSKLLLTGGVKNFVFVSPKLLQMPQQVKQKITAGGGKIVETERLEEMIHILDVIYVTRVQKERFTDEKTYEKLKLAYVITPALMKKAKEKAILMHPLPRVGEIEEGVDSDTRALYLREEMKNGLFVRMALLEAILKNK